METYWSLYQRHPWVRTCVDLIAEAVAAEGFSVVPVDGESRRPQSAEDDSRVGDIVTFFRIAFEGSTFTRHILATAVDLCVYSIAYWRKQRLPNGMLLGFERLDPRRVSVKLDDARTKIASYLLRKTTDNGFQEQQSAETIQAADVVLFTRGGGDPIFGAPSSLEALDLTIAGDQAIRRHQWAFFRNGAVAGRTLINEDLGEEEARSVEKRLREKKAGTDNAYSTTILGGKWKVGETAKAGGNDLDFLKGAEVCRDEIFAVFKVPPGKVLNTKGALGQAGKTQDDDTFQRDAVLPIERAIYETLSIEVLAKEQGVHDLELVPKRLNQIRLDRFAAAKDLVAAGGTINEARVLMGLPPIDDPTIACDVPMLVGTKQPVAADEAPPTTDAPEAQIAEREDQLDEER